MKEKSFINLSTTECCDTYRDILKNSNEKWATAKLLSENGKYGSANTHLIISIEELIKALVVFLDGRGFIFRSVKGVNEFFYHHQIRHIAALLMVVSNIFGELLIELIKKVKNNPSEASKLYIELINDKSSFLEKFSNLILGKINIILKEVEWFSHLEKLRQGGLYVDFSNVVKTPLAISKQDYEEIYKRMKVVRKIGRMLIIAIARGNSESNKQLEQLKDKFKTEDYYSELEKLLLQLQVPKRKNEIFNPLLTFFTEMKNTFDSLSVVKESIDKKIK